MLKFKIAWWSYVCGHGQLLWPFLWLWKLFWCFCVTDVSLITWFLLLWTFTKGKLILNSISFQPSIGVVLAFIGSKMILDFFGEPFRRHEILNLSRLVYAFQKSRTHWSLFFCRIPCLYWGIFRFCCYKSEHRGLVESTEKVWLIITTSIQVWLQLKQVIFLHFVKTKSSFNPS